MSHKYIDINDISFSYDEGQAIFSHLSLCAQEKESIGIVGANGAGKSTLLKLLVGLEMPNKGEIRIDGTPLERLTLAKVREKIGYVFQEADNQLFMTTVREDIAFGPHNYRLPQNEVEARTQEVLRDLAIEHLADRAIHKLSGGEKKLVQIATILTMRPDIILMDEPTSGLDPKNRRHLIDVVNGLPHTKIIASHDLDFVYDTCERTIVLGREGIAADGPTREILRDEALLLANDLELPLSFLPRDRYNRK